MLKEAFDKTGHVQLKASDGTNVMLDDHQNLGNAPFADTVTTMPGKHAFTAKKDQSADRKEIDIPAGQITAVEWPVAAPVTSNATNPSATNPTTSTPTDGSASTTNNDGASQTPQTPTEAHRTTAGLVVPIAVGVVGLAGIGVGAFFLADSGSASDSAATLRSQNPGAACPGASVCGQLADLKDRYNNGQTMGPVFIGVGAALVVGAAALFFVWPKTQEKVSLTPDVGAKHASAFLTVKF